MTKTEELQAQLAVISAQKILVTAQYNLQIKRLDSQGVSLQKQMDAESNTPE